MIQNLDPLCWVRFVNLYLFHIWVDEMVVQTRCHKGRVQDKVAKLDKRSRLPAALLAQVRKNSYILYQEIPLCSQIVLVVLIKMFQCCWVFDNIEYKKAEKGLLFLFFNIKKKAVKKKCFHPSTRQQMYQSQESFLCSPNTLTIALFLIRERIFCVEIS